MEPALRTTNGEHRVGAGVARKPAITGELTVAVPR
jgi:hypothetical protein